MKILDIDGMIIPWQKCHGRVTHDGVVASRTLQTEAFMVTE
ncbi:hypothetical protein ACTM9V_15525 [Oliverpabstia intestinalis]